MSVLIGVFEAVRRRENSDAGPQYEFVVVDTEGEPRIYRTCDRVQFGLISVAFDKNYLFFVNAAGEITKFYALYPSHWWPRTKHPRTGFWIEATEEEDEDDEDEEIDASDWEREARTRDSEMVQLDKGQWIEYLSRDHRR